MRHISLYICDPIFSSWTNYNGLTKVFHEALADLKTTSQDEFMTSSIECCTTVVKQMDIKSLSECCKEVMDIKSLRGCGKVLLNSSFYSLDQVGTVSVFLQRVIQQHHRN